VVEVEFERIGVLRNPVKRVKPSDQAQA
jgi:hypothetical protein